MNDIIESSDEEQFAKRQKSCDLQVCLDAGEVETQFVETIDSAHDFFRFLQLSTRATANNRPRVI